MTGVEYIKKSVSELLSNHFGGHDDKHVFRVYDNAMNFSCNINENYNDYEIKIPVPVKNIKEISFILKEKKKNQKLFLISHLDYHMK
jgi:hypothetical protein